MDTVTTGKYYVSVTGLATKSLLTTPKFFRYTAPAYTAAQGATGNIACSKLSYETLYMTITVWEDKQAMRKYFRGEAHVAAMKQLKAVSSYGKIHGYFTDEMPSDSDAIEAWKKGGRRVHGNPNPMYGDVAEPEPSSPSSS
mmetsp:Transcript_15322/g.18649  ORF Transcript_15322/g.18649 Transcript_15322/m.18649 type:complete len:141 (-) Transcript_15322:2453-2875(-)